MGVRERDMHDVFDRQFYFIAANSAKMESRFQTRLTGHPSQNKDTRILVKLRLVVSIALLLLS